MNVLKHGSKLVSVGLLSLSMSAGFSGLAFAQTVEGALTVNPNPIVLDNSAASAAADGTSFSALILGTGLRPLDTYVVTVNAPLPCAVLVTPLSVGTTGSQTANNDGRATFAVNGTGCRPGTYAVTSVDTTTGTPGPSTAITLLPPSPSAGTPTPTPTPIPTPTPTPTPGPYPGPFPGQFSGQFTGQFNGTTTPGQVTGLTPAQLAEAFEEANEHHPAAQTGFAGRPTGFAGRPTGFAGRPTGLASRPAGLTGRSGRASRSTRATSQSSDDALLLELLQAVL